MTPAPEGAHPYGRDTTTDEVLAGVDLTGRRVLVTGSSSGLGEETVRALAAHGASVTMLARDEAKNAAAAERVRATVPDADLALGTVDLSDLASIGRFADAWTADHDAFDVLINNAGVMCCPLGHTADGFELQFGTNHLGHFSLTCRLLPALLAGDAPRVVNLSSAGHSISDVDLDDPGFARGDYDPWVAYGRSKSANVHFTRALARRYGSRGLLAFAVHPGMIATELGRHMTPELVDQMMARVRARTEAEGAGGGGGGGGGSPFKPVQAGAATQVWAATAPELAAHNGAYLADCQVGVAGGPMGSIGYSPWLDDEDTAERLWHLSEDLVGHGCEVQP